MQSPDTFRYGALRLLLAALVRMGYWVMCEPFYFAVGKLCRFEHVYLFVYLPFFYKDVCQYFFLVFGGCYV